MRLLRNTFAIAMTLAIILPAIALAQNTDSCSWESSPLMILGSFGNVANPAIVGDPVYDGVEALQAQESPNGSTPQVYVAWIKGLTDGDEVTASFWAYDETDGTNPGSRIWGHYTTSGDIDDYQGSASGNLTYSGEFLWTQLSHTWVFDSAVGTRDALVVEWRLYSPTGEEPLFEIDLLEVSTTSATAEIITPCDDPAVPNDENSWGSLKANF